MDNKLSLQAKFLLELTGGQNHAQVIVSKKKRHQRPTTLILKQPKSLKFSTYETTSTHATELSLNNYEN